MDERRNKYITPWLDQYSEQMQVRLDKREKLGGGNKAYKSGYAPSHKALDLKEEFGNLEKQEIEEKAEGAEFSLAGRVMNIRGFGKASFLQFDDGSAPFQIYVKKGVLEQAWEEEFQALDYGDIIYAEGGLFKTNKGELSLRVKKLVILSKSLRPLPEKFHGLSDPELCYRMRYVDLMINSQSREVLKKRSKIIRFIRDFFHDRDYLEVETPMLHSVVGGASAKPFKTHHNALGMDLVMRIAPELHLKRLVVGGMPRVFEINRCFRNEGLSVKHNPEFTTIEFYQAFATYKDLMVLTEDLLSSLVKKLFDSETISYQGRDISFQAPFRKLTMVEAVVDYTDLDNESVKDRNALIPLALKKGHSKKDLDKLSWARLLVLVFEDYAEENLVDPTFVVGFPVEVSPLARRNDENPEWADRFEIYINGWEMGNAFTELANPTDQLNRFAGQAVSKEDGDDEACDVDYDFVRALEYGLPPTAGEGIGIDRLTMILTDSPSIRDVIAFPQLKREHFFKEESSEGGGES